MNHLEPTFIFFYGTLKTTEPHCNITNLLKNENKIEYIGDGKLLEKRPLVVASRCNYPYILDITGVGEVFFFLINYIL